MLGKHAFGNQAHDLRLKTLRLGGIILDVIARPAERSDRVPIGTAGMNAERQAVAFGRRIDRPERAAPERHFAHRRHQYLDEARVGGAALDLRDGEFHVLQRDHDGSAQALIMGEPLGRDPVVDDAGEGARPCLPLSTRWTP